LSTMDASIISALAALTGATVGGLTSGVANWLNHRSQVRAQWVLHEKSRRQILYRDTGHITISQRDHTAPQRRGITEHVLSADR